VGAGGGVEEHAHTHPAGGDDKRLVVAAVQAADREAAVRTGREDETGIKKELAAGDRQAGLGLEQSAAKGAALLQVDGDRLRRPTGGDLNAFATSRPFTAQIGRASCRERV